MEMTAGARLPIAAAVAALAVTLLDTGAIAQAQVYITGRSQQVPAEPPRYGSARLTSRDTSGSRPYVWQDGGRTRTARLLPNLVLRKVNPAVHRQQDEEVVEKRGNALIVRRGTSASADSGEPVFLSRAGTLLTLPGGVLLVFHEHLSGAAIEALLAGHGIAPERLSPLGITNGFLLATDPGLPSLETANALAGKEGVRLASPNWSYPITNQ